MLSYALEFPLQDCLGRDFIEAVKIWLAGSPHTSLKQDQLDNIPSEGRWKVGSDAEHLESFMLSHGERETVAFRHTSHEREIEWTTSIVFSRDELSTWVGIRTSRESYHPQVTLPPALKPHLVRTIIERLGGGLDGEVYVSDKPVILQNNDLNMTVRLLNADADNYLPIVYLSADFDNKRVIDAVPLAKTLSGMAHVLVEPDREFSRALQVDVGSRNVYGGRVGVYWPNGERQTYYLSDRTPTQSDIRRLLSGQIRSALINRRPLSRCTWSYVEAETAREAFNRLKDAGSSNIDEYVAAFDSEMVAKNKQLEEAEAEVWRLKSQIRSIEGGGSLNGVRLDTGSEQSYFDGEVTEILRDALFNAVQNAQSDGRRAHVLAGILKLMPISETMQRKREELKTILRQYRSMDRETRNRLEELGFTITEDGKHYKLIYMRDERYTFPLPKTGSDYRGGLNSASDIGKRVF